MQDMKDKTIKEVKDCRTVEDVHEMLRTQNLTKEFTFPIRVLHNCK